MNSRERFWATMHYGDFDRPFQWEMEPYEETIKRWRKEGLPVDSDYRYHAGYDRFEYAPVRVEMTPYFEYETLEINGNYEVYRDLDGVIKKKRTDVPPPAMPQYVDYGLKGRADWPEFKKRFNPASPARFPYHWESMKRQYQDRDFALGLYCGSLYGWIRTWMGVEGISLIVYDDPGFLEEASEHITNCILAVMDEALDGVEYDFAFLWEDMAYKTASLIDPRHYRKIFMPHYKRITERLHSAGIDIIMLDSDGNVDELIPLWLDAGINCIYPMEVAAGMDVVQLRKKFGKDLLMTGGMDKRVMARDRASIKKMIDEKIPLMREGGYIPGCDHAIPPDIPWDNYVYYRELLNGVKA